ncbi:unnamed protein product [Ostreobium quekettii]|uniref:Uncharacterized protein n=1 Tax=Ostreobium quekettii TaxID=121088 RepID=A0A8S1JDP0_9CHLO|nr:unnamed protein product [Ostreobium quekettii]|eukprot:evm.model.scf_1079EXC.1 EVM.evm.TU.scf_1079EXC.1   scf_1079EXC:220-570(-)
MGIFPWNKVSACWSVQGEYYIAAVHLLYVAECCVHSSVKCTANSICDGQSFEDGHLFQTVPVHAPELSCLPHHVKHDSFEYVAEYAYQHLKRSGNALQLDTILPAHNCTDSFYCVP